jgi:hypothetical protein
MGCDIHAYIECFSKRESAQSQQCYVTCVAKDISFGRDYQLFGLFAGIRGLSPSVFPVKGIPSSPLLSAPVDFEYHQLVIEDDQIGNFTKQLFAHEYVSRTEAESLVKKRITEYANSDRTKIIKPGMHTPSWLSLNELILIRKNYLIENIDQDIYSQYSISSKAKSELLYFIKNKDEKVLLKFCFDKFECTTLYSCINAMHTMEKCNDDNFTRLVFWFDS